jgi:hypothetical protein
VSKGRLVIEDTRRWGLQAHRRHEGRKVLQQENTQQPINEGEDDAKNDEGSGVARGAGRDGARGVPSGMRNRFRPDQAGCEKKVESKVKQAKQEAKKKVEAKGQQVEQKVKKVETGQEDLEKKVDDLKKKVEIGQDDLKQKVDDVHKDVNDLYSVMQ